MSGNPYEANIRKNMTPVPEYWLAPKGLDEGMVHRIIGVLSTGTRQEPVAACFHREQMNLNAYQWMEQPEGQNMCPNCEPQAPEVGR